MEILAQITADMSYRSVSDFVNDSAKLRIKKKFQAPNFFAPNLNFLENPPD